MIPDPTLDVSQYLFHHDGIDLIWTTGGETVAAANAAGKPSLSVDMSTRLPAPRPTSDGGRRHADLKTFDASVICPAEQTCVVDEAIYDDLVAEFERLGGQLWSPTRSMRSPISPSSRTGGSTLALGQSCVNLGAMGDFEVEDEVKVLLAPTALRSRRARRAP